MGASSKSLRVHAVQHSLRPKNINQEMTIGNITSSRKRVELMKLNATDGEPREDRAEPPSIGSRESATERGSLSKVDDRWTFAVQATQAPLPSLPIHTFTFANGSLPVTATAHMV